MATKTKFIEIEPHNKCIACWDCVTACPKHVLKKMNVLVHKHVIVNPKTADNCIGCLKCLRICQHDVFKKVNN